MGAACCFFQAEDLDDRRCISLQCFIHPFANLYSLVFRRGEGPSTVSGATSLASQMVPTPDSFMCETFRNPPRPLPYDTDPKCSPSLQNGPVPKQGKSSSHCHEETEPLRLGNTSGVEILSDTGEGNALSCEGGSKICPDFSIMHPLAKFLNGEGYILNSLEHEDVCPTCLEEYTIENPKIVTQCSHHFHLGCIYEWMERSEACPVCGKAMVFDETS